MKNVRCKAAKWLVGNKTIEVGNKRSRVGNKSMKVGSKQVEVGSKYKSLENETAKVSISLSRRLILSINIDSLAAINQLGINQSESGITGAKLGIKHKKLGINKPELGINQNRPENPHPPVAQPKKKRRPANRTARQNLFYSFSRSSQLFRNSRLSSPCCSTKNSANFSVLT